MTLLAVALLAAATSVPAASARPLFLEGFVNTSKTCSDVPPDHRYSCAQQKSWGKCGATFMKGKCCQTCHGCDPSCTGGGGGGGGGGSGGKTCSDVSPDHWTCAQQKSWGPCGASFTKGKCCQTCHG